MVAKKRPRSFEVFFLCVVSIFWSWTVIWSWTIVWARPIWSILVRSLWTRSIVWTRSIIRTRPIWSVWVRTLWARSIIGTRPIWPILACLAQKLRKMFPRVSKWFQFVSRRSGTPKNLVKVLLGR